MGQTTPPKFTRGSPDPAPRVWPCLRWAIMEGTEVNGFTGALTHMSGVLVRGDRDTDTGTTLWGHGRTELGLGSRGGGSSPAHTRISGVPGRGGAGNGERLRFRLQAMALVMQPEQIEGAGPHLFPRCQLCTRTPGAGRRSRDPRPSGTHRSIPSPVAENAGVWGRGPHPGLELGVLTLALSSCHRCPLPGNPPPPRGSGSWARLGSFRWFLG